VISAIHRQKFFKFLKIINTDFFLPAGLPRERASGAPESKIPDARLVRGG